MVLRPWRCVARRANRTRCGGECRRNLWMPGRRGGGRRWPPPLFVHMVDAFQSDGRSVASQTGIAGPNDDRGSLYSFTVTTQPRHSEWSAAESRNLPLAGGEISRLHCAALRSPSTSSGQAARNDGRASAVARASLGMTYQESLSSNQGRVFGQPVRAVRLYRKRTAFTQIRQFLHRALLAVANQVLTFAVVVAPTRKSCSIDEVEVLMQSLPALARQSRALQAHTLGLASVYTNQQKEQRQSRQSQQPGGPGSLWMPQLDK